MATVRIFRKLLIAGGLGVALVTAAGPASADPTIDVSGVGPGNVAIDYSCEASAGVAAIDVMVGAPDALAPSATGKQTDVTCDGSQQSTVVTLTGAPISAGQTVQVRAALVDSGDMVVHGQAKVVSLS
ncbi:hypothetical protein [Nocardia stercoris]|uniref:DUF5666 domain-containing protein n=1 Tax=Nocardia stercoris TaxID=2483361 RepID=A0A3M2LDH8_9NOCA|nr:hypothetical protein [Nocardia stercoris]RMI35454.1 hypothetical protein EBN03_04135 [Nocardia stercoris]